MVLDGAEQVFGDRATFESLTGVEVRTWYVVEWSAAVATPDYHLLDNIFGEQSSSPHPPGWEGQQPKHIDTYYMQARNSSLASPGRHYLRCQIHTNNPVGTIRWVERLPGPPTSGEW